MSVSIILYNMNKKRNSSKQPINTDIYKTVTGNFVEDSSMFAPVFTLSRDEVLNIAKFNYFSIAWPSDSAVTTRYYWVKDKVAQKDGTLKVSGFEDCFATFRTHISNSSFYVKRSDYSYRDELPDTSFSIGSEPKHIYHKALLEVTDSDNVTVHFPYSPYDTDGVYIVGVAAPETIDGSHITPADTSEFKRGGIKYYTFNPSDMYDFIKAMERMQVGRGADYKMTDFIVSCMYLPIDIKCFGLEWAVDTKNTYFMLSYNEDTNQGYWVSITNRHYISSIADLGTVHIQQVVDPKDANDNYLTHPQYSSYGKMANAQPFVKVTLTDAMVGSIELPAYPLSRLVSYNIEYVLDLVTGYITINCHPIGVQPIIHSVSSSIGVPIALSAISTDSYVNRKMAQTARNKTAATTMISPVLGAVGGAMSGGVPGAIVGAVGGLAAGIVNTVVGKDQYDATIYQNSRFESEVIGNNGTLCVSSDGPIVCNPIIWYRYYEIDDTANFIVHPRIVNKYILGTSLYLNSAFAICENAQLLVNTGLTYDEEQIICDQLNSGFFFE